MSQAAGFVALYLTALIVLCLIGEAVAPILSVGGGW